MDCCRSQRACGKGYLGVEACSLATCYRWVALNPKLYLEIKPTSAAHATASDVVCVCSAAKFFKKASAASSIDEALLGLPEA